VFGSRFIKAAGDRLSTAQTFAERLANLFCGSCFASGSTDTTNAFKRIARGDCRLSSTDLPALHLTVELPLKRRAWLHVDVHSDHLRNRRTGKASSRSRRWAVATFLCACTCGSKSTSAAAIIGSAEAPPLPWQPSYGIALIKRSSFWKRTGQSLATAVRRQASSHGVSSLRRG